jgi:hypothetical protein
VNIVAAGMQLTSESGSAVLNYFKLGGTPTAITFASGTGLYADGAGNFRVGANTGSLSDYLRYSPSVGLDIQTTRASINAGGLRIVASPAVGAANAITMGSNVNNITLNNNEGFYADGGGNFRIGSDATGSDFFQFTPSVGFSIKARSFFLSASDSVGAVQVNTSFLTIGKPAPTSYAPNTTVAGFYANSSGQFFMGSASLVDASNPATQVGNFISFGTNILNIRSTVFRFSGGNIVLDSAQNGLLALGNANSLANGMGFYADGLGNFRVGTATTSSVSTYMQFTGGRLTIQGQVSINDPASVIGGSGSYTDIRQVIANYIAFGPFGFYMNNL